MQCGLKTTAVVDSAPLPTTRTRSRSSSPMRAPLETDYTPVSRTYGLSLTSPFFPRSFQCPSAFTSQDHLLRKLIRLFRQQVSRQPAQRPCSVPHHPSLFPLRVALSRHVAPSQNRCWTAHGERLAYAARARRHHARLRARRRPQRGQAVPEKVEGGGEEWAGEVVYSFFSSPFWYHLHVRACHLGRTTDPKFGRFFTQGVPECLVCALRFGVIYQIKFFVPPLISVFTTATTLIVFGL